MLARLTRMSPIVLAALLFPVPALGAVHHPMLLATPGEGHSGDVIYMSGGGFAPHQQLGFDVTCGGGVPGMSLAGPLTSARGSFVAFRIPTPTVSTSKRLPCTVYATSTLGRREHLSGTIPARYTLVPTTEPLSRCAQRMCVKVTPVLVLTRRGVEGTVVVATRPGAVALVDIMYPGGRVKYRGVAVDWGGTGAVKVRIATNVKKALKVRVFVSAVLGSMSGTTTANPIIFPGLNR